MAKKHAAAPMAAVLVNVRSLHNVGSIFRTSDAAGIEKIYLTGITPTPLDRFGNYRAEFRKVALGAERTVPWERVTQTKKLFEWLRREGYTIIALERAARATPYTRGCPPDKQKIALIVGNEVRGVPPAVLKGTDRVLEIPMAGKKESLNVAVAFGIAAFHLRFCRPHAKRMRERDGMRRRAG